MQNPNDGGFPRAPDERRNVSMPGTTTVVDQLDFVLDGRYRLINYIGGGSFGMVYRALDLQKNKYVAVKLEHLHPDNGDGCLHLEYDYLKMLRKSQKFPRPFRLTDHDEYRVMIFQLLGPSLYDLFKYCGSRFSLKTVLMLADQLISRLSSLHHKNIIHQDIAPSNVLMGAGEDGYYVYLGDLGCASDYYKDAKDKFQKYWVGTTDYMSYNALRKKFLSPRDDLESLGYLLVYFLKGSLPWRTFAKYSSGKTKWAKRAKNRIEMPLETLCSGLPDEFLQYFKYVRSLKYDSKPNYRMLQRNFKTLFDRQGFKYDYVYDWTEKRFREIQGEYTTDESEDGNDDAPVETSHAGPSAQVQSAQANVEQLQSTMDPDDPQPSVEGQEADKEGLSGGREDPEEAAQQG